ncbi:MAG: hypothetical protein K0S77_1930, partial [Pseudomonas sp.]|nr:hypothetical protein [Pseudomonas sp.]
TRLVFGGQIAGSYKKGIFRNLMKG